MSLDFKIFTKVTLLRFEKVCNHEISSTQGWFKPSRVKPYKNVFLGLRS